MQDGQHNSQAGQQCKESLEGPDLKEKPVYVLVERGGVVLIPGQEQPAQPGQISAILKEWDAMLAASPKPTKEQCAIQRQEFEAMCEAGTSREAGDAEAAAKRCQAEADKLAAESKPAKVAKLQAVSDKGDQ